MTRLLRDLRFDARIELHLPPAIQPCGLKARMSTLFTYASCLHSYLYDLLQFLAERLNEFLPQSRQVCRSNQLPNCGFTSRPDTNVICVKYFRLNTESTGSLSCVEYGYLFGTIYETDGCAAGLFSVDEFT
jgi:hypothetical protein